MKSTILCCCLLVTTVARSGASETISVCDVITSLNKYNGKLISVRGISASGEGAFLTGRECTSHLVTDGFVWPDVLAVMSSRDSHKLHPVGYQSDIESNERVIRFAKRAGIRRDDTLIITITGVVQTADDLMSLVGTSRSGEKYGLGYGHLNDAPALIVQQTTSDPEIVRCKSIRPAKAK